MKAESSHWQLDRKIGISHLIATVGLFAAVFAWVNKVDTATQTAHLRIDQISRDLQRIEKSIQDNNKYVRDDIKTINNKLDKLLAKLPR